MVPSAAPTAAVETLPLAKRVAESMDQPRFAMTVLVSFAALAFALAPIGLYGVLSYGVSQRRRELDVRRSPRRVAARSRRARRAREADRHRNGLAIGLVAAAAATRLMQGLLYGVAPLDAVSFVAAPMALVPVAVFACLLPASRAASTDPADALRCE